MIGATDVGARLPTSCFILSQVKNGDFVRVVPMAKGTFSCDPRNFVSVKLDLIK